MFLERPAFPAKFSELELREKVGTLLGQKGITKFYFSDSNFYFVPYWFFSFDIFSDSETKTELKANGTSAFNSFSLIFDEGVAKLASMQGLKKESQPDEDLEFEVLSSKVSEKEIRDLMKGRLASIHGVKRDGVILSGVEMFFVPFWGFKVNSDSQELEFRVNAVNGDVLGEQEVKERQKEFNEIFSEALQDLTNPSSWIENIKNLTPDFSNASTKKQSKSNGSFIDQLKTNEELRLILLGAIAIAVILWAVYVV